MWRDFWEQLLAERRGPTIGMICGIVMGILYLIVGFWDMLIFGFIVYVGFYAGMRADKRESLFPFGELFRKLTERWRMFR